MKRRQSRRTPTKGQREKVGNTCDWPSDTKAFPEIHPSLRTWHNILKGLLTVHDLKAQDMRCLPICSGKITQISTRISGCPHLYKAVLIKELAETNFLSASDWHEEKGTKKCSRAKLIPSFPGKRASPDFQRPSRL